MKNVQKPEKMHLGKLIEELRKGKFLIPDFQRAFEWEPWDVRDLIKSIFMDYYIGTLLLWKGNKHNYDALSCEPVYGYKESKQDPEYIVLDGQQRLTALYYTFFQPDKKFPKRKNPFLYFIDVNELLDENYEEAIFYESTLTRKYIKINEKHEEQYKLHLFPLGVMQGGTWEVGDWIKGYRDYWQEKNEEYKEKLSGAENEQYTPEIKQKLDESSKYIQNARELKELMGDLLTSYQISSLRNSIKHNRGISEVTRLEGEASLIWFEDIL